ncbi:MAG TPA: ATP synthase subunit I [Chloroflexota bacterium]|nr:ATP synthase subunit I [Chloroflexota bacterium]
MALRPLVITGGAVATALLLPVVIIFILTDHPEVVRGLLLGLVTGLLNNLLLARKLDRVLRGQDAWQSLRLTMPRNMLLRFGLILLIAWAAARTHGINLPAMAAGLGLCLLVGIVYSCWAVLQRWRKEDGAPVYG